MTYQLDGEPVTREQLEAYVADLVAVYRKHNLYNFNAYGLGGEMVLERPAPHQLDREALIRELTASLAGGGDDNRD